jgi:hypothetical protein
MTGEITLSGKVTPIGGVREKVIAALRAGIRDVVMPADNEKDLEDVPQEVRSKITFHFVRTIDEVLKIAMPKNVKPFVQKRSEKTKDEFYEYDDYLFQKVEPEEKKPEQKTDSESEAKPAGVAPETEKSAEEKKPVEDKNAAKPAEPGKPEEGSSAPAEEKKPELQEPAQSEVKTGDGKPAQEEKMPESAPAQEEKKPEHHPASQFEFRKPTLVLNYGKFNGTFTVGQPPLKAPEQHPLPGLQKPAPAKSFKAAEKYLLDVKITTETETGDDSPVISLNIPVKTEPVVTPARKKAVRKTASRNFRPAKTQKLQVRVSSSAQGSTPAPEKKNPRKSGAPAKKGN